MSNELPIYGVMALELYEALIVSNTSWCSISSL